MKFLKNFLRKKRNFLVWLIIAAFGIVGYLYSTAKKDGDLKSFKVARGSVREEMILSGEVRATEHASLSFLSSGRLEYIGVKEGQRVRKGEVLARLDPTNAYQTFLQAEDDLRRYQASLEKIYDEIKGHEKDESFAQRELRTIAETNRDKAYRNYVIARKNLADLSLRAPFDGIVASITYPFVGINTTLTQSQIEIVNPETIYFSVAADQTEVINLKVGQKVHVILDSFPKEEFEGEIDFIGYTPKSGEVGTVYEVKIRFSTMPDTEKVRIGMSGDAKFILSEKEDVLYVPPSFIHSDAKGKYVNVGKRKNKRYIEVGIESEDRVEIKGDIREGDVVYD